MTGGKIIGLASQKASEPSALRSNSPSEGQQARTGAKKIILAAGGTGGHVFTAIATADELQKRGYAILFLTDIRGEKYLKTSGYKYKIISSASPNGLLSFCKLALGTLQSFILFLCRPKAVVGFGGYPSFPPLMAAKLLGLKTVLHEQNSVLGKANRFLAKSASIVATAFPETKNAGKATYVGQPVRKEITATPYPPTTGKLNILVTGGSQGAKLFAEILPEVFCQYADKISVTHQVPDNYIEQVKSKYQSCNLDFEVKSFFDNMPQQLAKTHLLIARAGSSTVFELAASGRPALFIPLKIAADNHQYYNAKAVCDLGGGWLLEEKDLQAAQISAIIGEIIAAASKLETAAENIKKFAKPEAAANLANLIETLIR